MAIDSKPHAGIEFMKMAIFRGVQYRSTGMGRLPSPPHPVRQFALGNNNIESQKFEKRQFLYKNSTYPHLWLC